MNKELINEYIALPMAIKVFRQDRETFATFKLGNLYQDKLDATIEKMKEDFYAIKKELLTKHHTEIKRIDQCKYNVNGKIVEYSPGDLKATTGEIMRDYLYGGKAVIFERTDRIRNN